MSAGRFDHARLESWKAIAAYLNRDVRTVQRWEAKERLPVHRLQHQHLASIYAYSRELDEWLTGRSVGPMSDALPPAAGRSCAAQGAEHDAGRRPERRDVTVLVISVARRGQLADERRPEQLAESIATLSATIDACRERFDAHILANFGDHAVLAFGFAQVAEDDAVRAARAAHWVRHTAQSLGIPVASGLAFGPMLTQTRDVAAAAGPVLDEARGLAAHAAANDILLGSPAGRILAPFFEMVAKEPVVLAGATVAVRALGCEASVRSRFDAAARRGLSTYVGRSGDIQRLLDAWRLVGADRGWLLHVLGEAGIGKSRLLLEFRRVLGEGAATVVLGRCGSHGRATPYLPLVESFGAGLAIGLESVSEDTLAQAVRALEPSLECYIPHYLHLLGIASSAHPMPSYLQGFELKAALGEALVGGFMALAARRPLVLLLEDWHWADDGSIDVLQHLAAAVSTAPLLVVVTSRSDTLPAHAVPFGADTLTLEPLSLPDTADLVHSLVGEQDVSADFVQQVCTRTGGNPFFVEELCDSLREEGRSASELDGVQIPSTVQALIRARIDRLATDDREVLRTAAIVGRECSRDTLAQLLPGFAALDDSLRRLTGARILQALRFGPDARFRFKHNLTQEVAYLCVPAFERKALHRQLAEHLSDQHASQLDLHAHLLAFHFARGDAWAQATCLALRAAQRSFALTQFSRTVELLEQAQRSYARSTPAEVDVRVLGEILLLEERACELLGHRTQQESLLAHALAALAGSHHGDLYSRALIRLGELRTIQARFEEATALISRALELCRTGGHRIDERSAWRAMAFSEWRRGSEHAAIVSGEHALDLAREIGNTSDIATDLATLAAIKRAQHDYESALALLATAEALGGQTPVAVSYLFQVKASIYTALGDHERARHTLEWVIDIQRDVPIHRVFSVLFLARLRLDAGDVDASEQLFSDCVGVCRRLQYAHGLSMALPGLADVHARAGRWRESAGCLEEALGLLETLHETDGLIETAERLAWAQVQLGDWLQARSAAERAAAFAVRLMNPRHAAAVFERLARGLVDRHAPHGQVRAAFERALQLAVDDEPARGRLLNALGIAEFTAGCHDKAKPLFDQARDLFERLGVTPAVALMLNSSAAALRAMGRPQEAIGQLEASLGVLDQEDDWRLRGHATALLGDIYREFGDPDCAHSWYGRSLATRLQLNDHVGQAWICHRMALLHIDAGLPDEAIAHLAAARHICPADAPVALQQALDAVAARLTHP